MSDIRSYEKELAFQADRRKATTEFIKIISDLWYDKAIEVVLFKNQIIDKISHTVLFKLQPLWLMPSTPTYNRMNDYQRLLMNNQRG